MINTESFTGDKKVKLGARHPILVVYKDKLDHKAHGLKQ
jgi:hypothetical protein